MPARTLGEGSRVRRLFGRTVRLVLVFLRIRHVNPTEHDWLMSTGRVRLVRKVRGPRPEAEWAKSNSAHVHEVVHGQRPGA
jgi:hypothetical protein